MATLYSTRYYGQTNHRPSRVRVTTVSDNGSVTVQWASFNHAALNAHRQAVHEVTGQPVTQLFLIGNTSDERGYVFMSRRDWIDVPNSQ